VVILVAWGAWVQTEHSDADQNDDGFSGALVPAG
jgi:hypothetical protein